MSIAQAADYLGVDPSTARKKANCNMDAYVDSVTYGKVKVFIKGMPFVDKPSHRLPQFEDLNVDTSLLPVNKVFLFDQYLNQMELGPFDKVRDAVDAMSVKFQKKFFTMINKDALIYSHALGASYFLVSNQVSKLKARIVRNLTDCTSTEFGSMTSAINSLEPSIKVPAFVRKYVLKGEPYESKGKQYLVEFVNKGDHDDTVRRVKSERHTNYKNSLSKA
uniref:Uncharacterized protein n=1 Tax=Dioszegia changbaiensis TaxID=234950 RepID=A0A7G7XQD7_9TREE|nr:hypothetical protein [Dioszegia changbaiensis]